MLKSCENIFVLIYIVFEYPYLSPNWWHLSPCNHHSCSVCYLFTKYLNSLNVQYFRKITDLKKLFWSAVFFAESLGSPCVARASADTRIDSTIKHWLATILRSADVAPSPAISSACGWVGQLTAILWSADKLVSSATITITAEIGPIHYRAATPLAAVCEISD